MTHGILAGRWRRMRQGWGGPIIPLVAGFLCILWAVIGAVVGCNIVTDTTYYQAQNAMALAIIGGLYMLLTGLWFGTRPAPTWRRVIGLMIMIAGVQWGTWTGIYILASNADGHFGMAHAIFFAGLAIHILGVLIVWKE